MFDIYIGIDYSGAQNPVSRLKTLQVYAASPRHAPKKVLPPCDKQPLRWTRKKIAEWLIQKSQNDELFIAGIDHAFSMPSSYLARYRLANWDDFLDDFCKHWQTDKDDARVDDFRKHNKRIGDKSEFRLTEKWTSSAKSVFEFDVPGQVAKSTHAGIPWLRHMRQRSGDKIHFFPFDGWDIPKGKSVIAEVYPSLFSQRYPIEVRTTDEHDAYSVARWLSDADQSGFLSRYLRPALTDDEKRIARKEGWILGL